MNEVVPGHRNSSAVIMEHVQSGWHLSAGKLAVQQAISQRVIGELGRTVNILHDGSDTVQECCGRGLAEEICLSCVSQPWSSYGITMIAYRHDLQDLANIYSVYTQHLPMDQARCRRGQGV